LASISIYLRLIGGSSVYGDTPTLNYGLYTASSGGTLITDASPSGSVTWSTLLSNTSAANTYSLTYTSGLTLGSSAYTLSAGDAVNWLINPRPITITAGSTSRFYGSANPTVTSFTVPTGSNGSGSGLVNGDNVSSVINTIAGTATATANAGTTHAITPSAASFGSGNAGNYAITYADGTLTIDKANAVVTANSATGTYTGVAQSVTGFTVSGLVNGETSAVLDSVSTAGGSGTNAGIYTHTVSGTDENYNLTFTAGSLTILPVVIPPTVEARPPAGTATQSLPPDTANSGADAGGPINPNPLLNVNPVSVIPLAGSGGVSGELGAGGISISLNMTSTANAADGVPSGIVTVSVPKAMATSGAGLSFELPAQVRESLGTGPIVVTLADGSPLPQWIQFNPATQRFEAGAVPDGGLPLQILLRRDKKQVLIAISERAE
jgi:hypothetical protein